MTALEIQRFILERVRESIDRDRKLTAECFWFEGLSRSERGRINTLRADASDNTTAYTPSVWLRRPLTDAERQAFSRALLALQHAGKIQRIGNFGRTTHIKLLEAPA